MYDELIGKYLNGYKIVRIEKDPFIKGQINLWTNEEKRDVFGDRSIVKFFIREKSNTAKIYQELVDKEKYELQQKIDKAIEYIESNPLVIIGDYRYFVNDLIQMEEDFKDMSFIRTLLAILKEV